MPNDDALIENNNIMVHHRRRAMHSHLRPLPTTIQRELYEFKVEKINGLPVSLSCKENHTASSSSENNDTRTTLDSTIEFDYELILRDPMEDLVEILQQDLPKWEFFLLYYVADDIGILGCDLQKKKKQNITAGITNSSQEEEWDIVSLSSYGIDVVDTRVESCQFLVDLEPGWICIPLLGTMKVEFIGNESDRAAVETFMAYHVASVLNNSSDFNFGIGVNKTIFVGSRVIPSPIVADGRVVEDDSDNSVVALVSSLSAAAILLGMLLFLWAVARRRRSKSDAATEAAGKEVVVMGGADHHLEDGGSDGLTAVVPCTPTKSLDSKSTNNSDEDKSDEARCGSVDLASRLGREVIDPVSGGAAAPYSLYTVGYPLTNNRTASTVSTTEDSEMNARNYHDDASGKGLSKTTLPESNVVVVSSELLPSMMIDSLPPKHPTGPSAKAPVPPTVAAKLPKTRRRRKKKKKKAVIVRSNSRENIKEMETITEGEEETSGDNEDADGSEDEGSWCSTSDSEPGSRDPSPARSSRNSSREPSPARSTGSGGDSDVAAVTSPPLPGSMDTARRSTLGGPSSDTTSGTEKPKPTPKRLPPSWQLS